MTDSLIKPGRYRHYKGNEYEVLGLAKHSETNDLLVVYRPCYAVEGGSVYRFWVRPMEMFFETVLVDGAVTPRFAFLG